MAKIKIQQPDSFNEHYTPSDIESVHKIINWMNGSTLRSNRWLSRCAGVSDSYISTLLAGKHPVPAQDLLRKIIPIMEDGLHDKLAGEFVETSIWHIVKHACKMAKAQAGFSIVAGQPGVGKTESLEHYQRINSNTIYMRGSEVTNSTTVIDMLVTALNLKNSANLRKSAKLDDIVNALKDSGRLIILDEADKCQKDTPDPLRTISDATGCGVVLAGNTDLRRQVKAGDNRYDLIESRVVFWPKIINKVSQEDAYMLMRPYIKNDMISPEETYEEIAKYAFEIVDGSARKLVKTLINHLLMLDEQSKKTGKNNYKGISRLMMKQIAQQFMGIDHPPAIPRRESTIVA